MIFELYGQNKVHLSPGGYYNLNKNNDTELMVVKLSLLQAHIDAAINHVAETSEEPKPITNGDDIMRLADLVYAKYQKDIENGNAKLFEEKNAYLNKDYDYLHPNPRKDLSDTQSHTSGPWITDTSHKHEFEGITVWAGDVIIAHVVDDQHMNAANNAKLIKAAPDLLKICHEIADNQCDLKDSERRIRLYSAIMNAEPETKTKTLTSDTKSVLDGWKYATNYTKDNIQGAMYEKMYGGVDSPLYEMTIAERDGKYIPYHGSIAMPECDTIIQAAKDIDNYYDTLSPEDKYSDTTTYINANKVHHAIEKWQHGATTDNEFVKAMQAEGVNVVKSDDGVKTFTGKNKHGSDIIFEVYQDKFKAHTIMLSGYAIDTIVKPPSTTPTYPALTPTEQKELADFTSTIKQNFPEARTEDLHRLCNIASDMKKCTVDNAKGFMPDEKYNDTTDHQEKQAESIINTALPGTKVFYGSDWRGAAIKLELPQGQRNGLASYNVPEIPKNKLTLPQDNSNVITPVKKR